MKKTKSSDPSHTMEKPERESTCRISSRTIVSSNEDLMVNILSRLPVKALSRFKCVSKQWNMLMSDPCFVSTHQGRATQDPNIMKLIWDPIEAGMIMVCSIEEKEERKVTHDLVQPNIPDRFVRKFSYAKMVGRPCNGLICLEDSLEGRPLILVCNPATRNTVAIPRGKKREFNYLQGLGFCPSSNEFKVVRLYERSKGYGCELFTVGQRGFHPLQPSRSRSWRQVGDFPYLICYPDERNMCYVNGRVHWIMESLSDSSSEVVLSLDLELEEFKVVSCPEHWPEDVSYEEGVNLIELGGELCIVFLNCDVWDIWALKDYINSIWSKEYQIDGNMHFPLFDDSKVLFGMRRGRQRQFQVVGIRRRRLLLIIDKRTFCYYDPRNNSFEVIMEEYLGSLPCRVDTFVENLVIPF